MKIGQYVKSLRNSYRDSKGTFIFYTILRVLVIISLIRNLFHRNFQSAAICVLSLVLFLIPALLQDKMKLTIPPLFQAIIFGFIFAAEILGEVNHYYVRIHGWDTMLHTADGLTYTVDGGYLDIGILDTMKDLLVNLVGAVVFSIIGYSTLKFSRSSKVAESLIIKPKEKD